MAQHCLCFAPHSIAPLCFIRKRANPSPAKPSAQKGLQAEAMLRHMPAFPEEDTLTFRIAMQRSGVDAQRLVRVRAAKLLLAAGLAKDQAPGLFSAGRAYAESLLLPDGRWKIPMDHTEDALLAYAVLSYPGKRGKAPSLPHRAHRRSAKRQP